jgi:hypothetical protein
MEQTDLDWLREYCLTGIAYRDSETEICQADIDRNRVEYDRAEALFDDIQRAMFRVEHSRPD